MLELVIVVAAGLLVWYRLKMFKARVHDQAVITPKASEKLDRLWKRARSAISERRYRAAEKTLLSILKIDHKNAAAYNRLGTIYAKQHNLDDARECFEIASSLTPTLASLYNLGLVEYELGNYQQAANAFEKVIDLEPTPQRYVAFAKAQNKLGNMKKVITALEAAIEIQQSAKLFETLAQAYESIEEYDKATEVRNRAQRLRRRGGVRRPAQQSSRRVA